VTAAAAERADQVGALRVGPAVLLAGAPDGPLAGTETVVKDLFAIAGQRTGAGNPDWLAGAPVNTVTATAVRRLTGAGATVVGIAHTDELAFSLSGTNVHYGTPLNSKAPERVPGGSSSGPASAVAAGLVPYALGTDTGGSIRIPASYCGIFGYRPTWERPPKDGLVPLAPFFDTPGILAAQGRWLRAAGRALLASGRQPAAATGITIAADLVALAEPEAGAAVAAAAARLARELGLGRDTTELGPERLARWRAAFMARQLPDIWAVHGPWVTARQPSFGPGVTARMRDAAQADPARGGLADQGRLEVRAVLGDLLPAGRVLALPAASGAAPRLDLDMASKAALRGATIAIACVAGLGGLPAVSLPLAAADGAPLGLCLVGRPGDDELLLDLAARADSLLGP
jgi:amidase